jgi:hypothetical protein
VACKATVSNITTKLCSTRLMLDKNKRHVAIEEELVDIDSGLAASKQQIIS